MALCVLGDRQQRSFCESVPHFGCATNIGALSSLLRQSWQDEPRQSILPLGSFHDHVRLHHSEREPLFLDDGRFSQRKRKVATANDTGSIGYQPRPFHKVVVLLVASFKLKARATTVRNKRGKASSRRHEFISAHCSTDRSTIAGALEVGETALRRQTLTLVLFLPPSCTCTKVPGTSGGFRAEQDRSLLIGTLRSGRKRMKSKLEVGQQPSDDGFPSTKPGKPFHRIGRAFPRTGSDESGLASHLSFGMAFATSVSFLSHLRTTKACCETGLNRINLYFDAQPFNKVRRHFRRKFRESLQVHA